MMSEEYREMCDLLRSKVEETMALLTTLDDMRNSLHELEKTISRLHNETTDIYCKIDDALDDESDIPDERT